MTVLTAVAARADVPVDVTRDEARRAAERELADPIYRQDEPTLLGRAAGRVLEEILELFARAAAAGPGGYAGLLVLLVVLVLVAIAVRVTAGRVRRTASAGDPLFASPIRTAAEHRRAADEFAARGEWAEAVRERLRAIVRDLEERDLLEIRAGRTADEAAREAGAVLPSCADGLRNAARIFDDVWYGGRTATSEMDARLREVDAATRRARPVSTAAVPL